MMCKLHPIQAAMLQYLEQYYLGLLDQEMEEDEELHDEDFIDHLEFMRMCIGQFKNGKWTKETHRQEWSMLFEVYQEQLVEDFKFLS